MYSEILLFLLCALALWLQAKQARDMVKSLGEILNPKPMVGGEEPELPEVTPEVPEGAGRVVWTQGAPEEESE